MCTAIIGFDPAARVPLVVAALRDEMTDRSYDLPAAHWPEWPHLVGGRDREAGGTWLAVAAGGGRAPRLGAVLNGRIGDPPSPGRRPALDTTVPPGVERRTRGLLPLHAAATGELGLSADELIAFDPFHLLVADLVTARLLSWDGQQLAEHRLEPGVTMVVNTGLDASAARSQRYQPEFERTRPDPAPEVLRDADGPEPIWGDWVGLLDAASKGAARTAGFGTGEDDPSSLVARIELDDGRIWATGSITLVAASPDTVRYAFSPEPGNPDAWYLVRRPDPASTVTPRL